MTYRPLFLRLTLALVSIGLVLGVAELALRVSNHLETAADPAEAPTGSAGDRKLDYGDTWREGGLGPGGFLLENFSGRVHDGLGGTVWWQNNSQGFRYHRDTALDPGSKALRILSLGDSFAGGYRVGQTQTYSWLLEQWLQERRPTRVVEIPIAVIEEPATGLFYLQTHGLDFQPDVVLLGITLGNDLAQAHLNLDPLGDYRLTGEPSSPIERNPDANEESVVARLRELAIPERCVVANRRLAGDAPEAIDARAPPLHLMRLVDRLRHQRSGQAVTSTWPETFPPRLFDGNGLGFFLAEPPPEIETAFDRTRAVLQGYRDLTSASAMGLAVVLFPQRYQVQEQDWKAMIETHALRPECFDLQTAGARILAICEDLGIRCLDPTPGMTQWQQATSRQLYLPQGDMHWNAQGHRALFEQLRDWLDDLVQ